MIRETRIDHEGKPYQVVVAPAVASDSAYGGFVAGHLREYLYRQGVNVATLTDEQLLRMTVHTFMDSRAGMHPHCATPVDAVVLS